MDIRVIKSVSLAAMLTLAGTAAAHHPPKMDRCASFSFTGEIERIE